MELDCTKRSRESAILRHAEIAKDWQYLGSTCNYDYFVQRDAKGRPYYQCRKKSMGLVFPQRDDPAGWYSLDALYAVKEGFDQSPPEEWRKHDRKA